MPASPKYANIITLTWATESLLYSIPSDLEVSIKPGMLVEVPFGRTLEYGIVYNVVDKLEHTPEFVIKNISRVLYSHTLFGEDILQLIRWISRYYLAGLKNVAEAVIPSAIRKLVDPKISAILEIKHRLPEELENRLRTRSPKQFEVYQKILFAKSPVHKSNIRSPSSVRALLDKQIINERLIEIPRIEYRDKFGNDQVKAKNIILNPEQRAAADDIIASIDENVFCTHLLHGITGSGKTEVYIAAINRVLEQHGDVIVLVPELALTPQTVNRIRNGIFKYNDQVLVWHSGLSDGERRDAWLALSNGQAKIVIGARSAIFAPLKNLRLIIVDEEHEPSYKQSDTPRYHARDVAVYRAKLNHAVCILGSATPSLESLYNVQTGRYKLNILRHRIDRSTLPNIEIVDMQQENRKRIISLRLQNMIYDRLEKHEQTILFLNRRGFATIVLCKTCNYSAQCPCCSISLTYHHDQHKLLCHLCGHEEPLPMCCPVCGSSDILKRGIGSQRLEQVAQEIFPSARIARVDSDTITKKDDMRRILHKLQNNEIDILIGTQMIAKGLDFPNISLVGIIDIDGVINFPDFRSSERAFQLIIQVAGRAGRGDTPGRVVIQTYNPQSDIIQLAREHNFEKFTKLEIANRKEFFYPPFRHVIKLCTTGESEKDVKEYAQLLYQNLKYSLKNLEIKPATPAILTKINNKYRYIILIFSTKPAQDVSKIHTVLTGAKKCSNIVLSTDVDPIDLT